MVGPLLRLILLVLILCLFATCSFSGATLAHFFGMDQRLGQFVALSIAALYVGSIFLSVRYRPAIFRYVAKFGAVAMAFMNFAFVAALACWPAWWLVLALRLRFDQHQIAAALSAAAVGLTLYGFANAARLRVTEYRVKLPNLPAHWQGQRVVLVTDIHVGTIWGTNFVERIVARAKQLNPAAVFISGDMFDGAKVDITRSVQPWSGFQPPHGIFFVTGNHDEFGDPMPYLKALSAVGVRVLENEKVDLGGLQLVGVLDAETHNHAHYRAVLRDLNIDRGAPSILLAHRPSHLEIPTEAGVSLQLAGHTHSGQFFPWILLVQWIYGRFGYGHHHHRTLQVITSSGAGSGGPPMRVGTRSEIVLLHLENAG